jgi:hypothetical protein
VLAAFFCTRTASADAPMCDARGMSVDAPAPVLPIRDARIEGSAAPLCRDPAVLLAAGHRVRRGATVVDSALVESWMKTESAALPKRAAMRTADFVALGLMRASGHDAGVFRPPRRVRRFRGRFPSGSSRRAARRAFCIDRRAIGVIFSPESCEPPHGDASRLGSDFHDSCRNERALLRALRSMTLAHGER